MAAKQIISLPPFFNLADGQLIRITAVDPTTGTTVSGVVISNVSIDVDPNVVDVVSEPAPLGQIVLMPGAEQAA